MKINAEKLFKIFITIFGAAVLAVVFLGMAKSLLPANRLTHQCKPPVNIQLNALQDDHNYEQAFCQQYYHVEFKDSWNRTINNIAVPALLLSGLLSIPAGSVLAFRWLISKMITL